MQRFSRRAPLSALVLGIDVGGTKVAYALADESGSIHRRWRRATEPSGDAERDVARIAADARRLAEEQGGALAAVGVSSPGPLDAERGRVLRPPNLPGWGEVPLRDWLGRALGAPVALDNDANAAALAEWRFGAGRGARDLVYVTMSTGVGAGLVLGGRLHRGAASAAGEIGHAPVEWEGEPCACGLRGCLEAYVGGAAWTRRLRRVTPEGSGVAAAAGGRERVTPEHVLAAARRGDAFARDELARWNGYLARGLVQLVMTLAPERIVLGTIAAAAGEELCLRPLREALRRHVWPHLADRVRIEAASLGDDLPYRAGLCVALDALVSGG